MEVVRVGEPENGQAVVVLSTDRCLEQTTAPPDGGADLLTVTRPAGAQERWCA